MSDKSKIEWTNATWNPVTGCKKVSPGCKNCYAERDWKRLSANPATVYYGRSFTDVAVHESRLEQPLLWTKPKMIFVNSMSDLFHASIPFTFIDKVFAVMALCPQHTFQVLTKRADRMLEYFTKHNRDWDALRKADDFAHLLHNKKTHQLEPHLQAAGWLWAHYDDEYGGDSQLEYWGKLPLPNVWLGVSVENQEAANERIPHLLRTEAAVRWISAEPLLGAVDLGAVRNPAGGYFDSLYCGEDGVRPAAKIDWVVAGGESGPNARITNPDWYRSLRNQCLFSEVPFFFKQHGEFIRVNPSGDYKWMDEEGTIHELKDETRDIAALNNNFYYRIGKKQAGRILDGREWNEMPEAN